MAKNSPRADTLGTGRQHDDYFDEDFVEGAVASLRLSIQRVQWRASSGQWPNERIGKIRHKLESEIDHLIDEEIERRRLGEVTAQERSGPVIHRYRRGQVRMTPKK